MGRKGWGRKRKRMENGRENGRERQRRQERGEETGTNNYRKGWKRGGRRWIEDGEEGRRVKIKFLMCSHPSSPEKTLNCKPQESK